MSNGLLDQMSALITGGNDQDIAFVLSVLSAFEGKPFIYSLVRAIVTKLNPENSLLLKAHSVLRESGVVSGEFGFVELYIKRKVLFEE